MSKFERKFGKFAIPNLTLILILCYVAGYILELVNPTFLSFLTLDPYQIMHGQVWRLFTWVISPPADLSLFTLVMLFFYFSIGTELEREWGTYRYNVFIFRGMLITIIGAFLVVLVTWVLYLGFPESSETAAGYFSVGSTLFSTYYINMSIMLAYAITYPNVVVLLMFVIPVKVKWLGILYTAMLGLNLLECVANGLTNPIYWYLIVAIAASLINVGIFWLGSRNLTHLEPKQIKRRSDFKQQVKEGVKQSGHKCAICGRTDESNPELSFRYCSKCNGNYEYCQDHLFTHEHKE